MPGEDETHALTPPGLTSLGSRYRIEGELGAGGMGVVYRARDLETGEPVALKLLKPELGADPEVMERFKNELRLARRITHRNVCRIHDFNRAEGVAFISMELVEGESLRGRLRRPGGVTVEEAVNITLQICAGLREAHTQGIVHRDLKPENIMVDPNGGVKVMDFGIARSTDSHNTATGMIMGTPSYMPPEQVQGKTADARSDIYSLGLVLYEMFTGARAFSGDSAFSVAFKQISETPPRPSLVAPTLPPVIEDAILKCIEKDPARRFQTVDDLAEHLRRLGSGSETLPRPALASEGPTMFQPTPLTGTTVKPALQRRRLLKWGLAAAGIVAIGALAQRFWPETPYRIPIEQATLKNGLQVVISEDHSAPTFGLAMTYLAGSADDDPDHPGLAHFLEHLMFKGSAQVGRGEHDSLMRVNGGASNGATFPDRTVYFEFLPSNQVDLALFLEADRMRSIRIDPTDFANVQRVVMEEIRFRDEVAYGAAARALFGTAFDTFAYQHSPAGSVEDVKRATPEDAARFFRDHYMPNNAVLSLVGDVEPQAALRRVAAYFEGIPRQELPSRPIPKETVQARERRSTVPDPLAKSPRLDIGYKILPESTADRRALDVLVQALGGGPSARLQRKLIGEKELAISVTSGFQEYRATGFVFAALVPQPRKDVAILLKAFDEEVRRLQTEILTEPELQRARMRVRQQRLAGLQGTVSRAIALGSQAALFGDPTLLNAADREFLGVRGRDVQRVAQTWLRDSNRTIITTQPESGAAAKPSAPGPVAEVPVEVAAQAESKNLAPVSKELLRVRLPRATETTLENELTLLVLEDRRLPRFSGQLRVRVAGPAHEPAAMPGLAGATAQMLQEGAGGRTGSQIAEDLDRLGLSFVASAPVGSEETVLTLSGPSDTLKESLVLLAGLVRHPTFAADDLNRFKARLRAQLTRDRSVPTLLAGQQFRRLAYGAFSAGSLSIEAIDALSSERLHAWHRERFVPQNIILAIAGDVRGPRLASEIRGLFGDWPATKTEDVVPPRPVPSTTRQVFVVDLPGANQVTLKAGNVVADRRDPDYVRLNVADRLLSTRLFDILREQKGYAYNVGSGLIAFRYGGDWNAAGSFRPSDFGAAMRDLLHEIGRLCNEKVVEGELDAARRMVVAGFALSLERPSQVIDFEVTRKLFNFSPDYWDNYPGKVADVTADDVQGVACKYLNVEALQIVAVGDAKQLVPVLRPYGPVTLTQPNAAVAESKSRSVKSAAAKP